MMIDFWYSIVEWVGGRQFVTDKHGQIIFFPWGRRSKGYILKNKKSKSRIESFYTGLFLFYLIVTIYFSYQTESLVSIAIYIFIWLPTYLLIWYLYARNITKALLAAEGSYKDIVLEKITSDANQPLPSPKKK